MTLYAGCPKSNEKIITIKYLFKIVQFSTTFLKLKKKFCNSLPLPKSENEYVDLIELENLMAAPLQNYLNEVDNKSCSSFPCKVEIKYVYGDNALSKSLSPHCRILFGNGPQRIPLQNANLPPHQRIFVNASTNSFVKALS